MTMSLPAAGFCVVGLLPVVWFLTDWVVFTICLPILSPMLLSPSLNYWASAHGMLTRNVVHRIRMFLVFICNDYRSSKFTNESPNLRKKSELLYYNVENENLIRLIRFGSHSELFR